MLNHPMSYSKGKKAGLEPDKIRIAVAVSGGGTNLEALLKAEENHLIRSGKIVLVVSNRKDCYALCRAEKRGIPTFVFREEKELKEKLRQEKIDLLVLAGFLTILSKDFCQAFPDRIINIHPSLIPSFCGKGCYGIHVHEKALARGVKVTGATVHFVNEEPDGGRILLQKAVAIRPEDTAISLQRRVMEEAEWVLLPRAVEEVAASIDKEKKMVEREKGRSL